MWLRLNEKGRKNGMSKLGLSIMTWCESVCIGRRFMTVNAECIITIPLVCKLVPINMTLSELDSLAYNSYMSIIVYLLISMNVFLRTSNGLSVWDFDNTKTHRIFSSICTCFTFVLISFLILWWYFVWISEKSAYFTLTTTSMTFAMELAMMWLTCPMIQRSERPIPRILWRWHSPQGVWRSPYPIRERRSNGWSILPHFPFFSLTRI